MKTVRTRLPELLTCILIFGGQQAAASEPASEHTFELESGESPPPATLEDAGMLVGSWTGTAFGQRFEETWNPPSAGSMVGLFKLHDDDEVSFYELMLMTVEDGTLVMKVKHFNADFSGWEEKPDYAAFRLVKITGDELHFSGLSFYRRTDDLLDAYILVRDGNGARTEQHLVYERR